MRKETKNVIFYYLAVRFKERCMNFSYFSAACVALGFILVHFLKFDNNFWRSITLTFSFFTIFSVVACIIQDFRMKKMFGSTLKLSSDCVNDGFFKNMQDIKFIHDEITLYLSKMEMQNFSKLEDNRYRIIWEQYFLDWFMDENDDIYKYRQNPKNEFDEHVIRKHLNELGILQQKMLCLFGNDDEFSQIIGDHFKSLRQDFYNLIVLKR